MAGATIMAIAHPYCRPNPALSDSSRERAIRDPVVGFGDADAVCWQWVWLVVEDLDFVFRNIAQDPVSDELKLAFNRFVQNAQFYGVDGHDKTFEEFESFGKIVLFRERPVKPYFHRRFAQAAMALSQGLRTSAA